MDSLTLISKGCQFCMAPPNSRARLVKRLLVICYGTTNDYFLARTIDSIIYKETTPLVLEYKEMLYMTHEYEHLERLYSTQSSLSRIKQFAKERAKIPIQPRFYIDYQWGILNKHKRRQERLRKSSKAKPKEPSRIYPKILNQQPPQEKEFQNKISLRKQSVCQNITYETETHNVYNSVVTQICKSQVKQRLHVVLILRDLKMCCQLQDSKAFLDETEDSKLNQELEQVFKRVNKLSERQNSIEFPSPKVKPEVRPMLDMKQIDKTKLLLQGAQGFLQSFRSTPGQSQRSQKKINSARFLNLQQKLFAGYESLVQKLPQKKAQQSESQSQIEKLRQQCMKEAIQRTDPEKQLKVEPESERKDGSKSTDRPKWQNEQKRLLKILNTEIDRRVKIGGTLKYSANLESLIKIQQRKFSKSKDRDKNQDCYGYWTTRNCKIANMSDKNLIKLGSTTNARLIHHGSTSNQTSTQHQTTNTNSTLKNKGTQPSKTSIKESYTPISLKQNLFSLNYRMPRQCSYAKMPTNKN